MEVGDEDVGRGRVGGREGREGERGRRDLRGGLILA